MAVAPSEMNRNAVILKMSTSEKLGTVSWNIIPKTAILDSEFLYTRPAIQTAVGCADIMPHIFESYFNKTTDVFAQDKFSEGVLEMPYSIERTNKL